MKPATRAVLQSVLFWWVTLTCVYLILNLAGYPHVAHEEGATAQLSFLAGFVGLFVPFGFASAPLFVINPLFASASFIVFIVLMIATDALLARVQLPLIVRIIVSLLVLFALTFLVDLIRGTPLFSWEIFTHGRFMHRCC